MKKVKISVRRTKEGTIFEIISMVLVVIMWGIVARMWNRLPNRLPSHFDMVGNVDEWSDKNTLILLGVIATITTISLLVSAYFPRKTVHIHERIQNLRQMILAVRMVRICAIAMGILFLGIIFLIIRTTLQGSVNGGMWFIMGPTVALFAVIIYYSIKIFMVRDKH